MHGDCERFHWICFLFISFRICNLKDREVSIKPVARLGQLNLAEPVPLQHKPQPMSPNLKTRFGNMAVVATEETRRPGRWLQSRELTTHLWSLSIPLSVKYLLCSVYPIVLNEGSPPFDMSFFIKYYCVSNHLTHFKSLVREFFSSPFTRPQSR